MRLEQAKEALPQPKKEKLGNRTNVYTYGKIFTLSYFIISARNILHIPNMKNVSCRYDFSLQKTWVQKKGRVCKVGLFFASLKAYFAFLIRLRLNGCEFSSLEDFFATSEAQSKTGGMETKRQSLVSNIPHPALRNNYHKKESKKQQKRILMWIVSINFLLQNIPAAIKLHAHSANNARIVMYAAVSVFGFRTRNNT